jgi:RNA polymerase sigma-70 factor (ECF subfamily)
MAADDAKIMQAVKRGEFDQFDLLVERYRMPLIRVETFLAVFAARETYNPDFAFRTWLWTILLNLCRRQLKRQHRQPRQVPRSQLSPNAQSASSGEPVEWETGLSRLLQLERREQLAALLNDLPEAQGDALRLRFFGGLKFLEIAEAMNSSVSGAKRRVQNGLLGIAERLKQAELAEETKPAGCLLPEPDAKGSQNELR